MKTLATQRGRPQQSATEADTHKKIRLTRPVDIRRWKALRVWWRAQLSRGRDLNLARMCRRKGHANGGMASLILNGYAAINVEWMLYFAQELGSIPPQRIWKEDWPFPDLTPDTADQGLQRVGRCWGQLSETNRRKVVALAESQRLR